MAFIDYYKVLGVDKDTTQDEIRKAYRRLAKRYHPDINNDSPEAKERFQEINEANEVLSDPEKRRKYDEYGENWRHADEFEAQRGQYRNGAQGGYNFGGFGGFGDFGSSAGNTSGFSDFFEELFGHGAFRGGKESRQRGGDIHATLPLTLHEAATTHRQQFGVNGETVSITVPAGIADGQKIRIKGKGKTGVNGERGDLYITFGITPDSRFTREGDDLHTTATIDAFTLLLGGEVIVPTLNGNIKATIKPGTQPGSKLRLRGKGFPVYKQPDRYGDLIVTIAVTIPQLSERQREEIAKILER